MRASALDARRAGLQVYLIEDATRAISEEGRAEALDEMRAEGVQVLEA